MIVVPPRRHFEPRPYQLLAQDFLLNTPRAMLAAPPGLGKTSTVYAVLDILKMCGSNFFPALVVAPKQVAKAVWTGEARKWDRFVDLTVQTVVGDREQRLAALRAAPIADVYTVNYENLDWLMATLGERWPFKTVIADESTRLKNFRLDARKGRRSTALSYIVRHTGRWINLSGTPMPNGYQDLWGQFWFVDQGVRLGRTYTNFLDQWFTKNEYTRAVKPRPGAAEEITVALMDVMMSLRVEDWFDLQEPMRVMREVELPPKVRGVYDQMEKDYFAEIGAAGIEAVNSGVKAQKLLELASGSMYDEHGDAHEAHDLKNELLESIVNELQEPLMVVYWWDFDAPRIKKAFPHARVYRGERERADWNAGKIDMLLINPAQGGHGLDFQDGGRAICHYSNTWDAELRDQVNARLGPVRQAQSGHNRAVLEYYLVAKDTIDMECVDRVDGKLSEQDVLMRALSRRH